VAQPWLPPQASCLWAGGSPHHAQQQQQQASKQCMQLLSELPLALAVNTAAPCCPPGALAIFLLAG